jgi:hypothetical protein
MPARTALAVRAGVFSSYGPHIQLVRSGTLVCPSLGRAAMAA